MRLVINEPGSFVGVKAGRIRVRRNGNIVAEVAAPLVEQVVVSTRGATLSSALLRLLAKFHIELVVLSGYGFPVARLVTTTPGTVNLRHKQYATQNDSVAYELARSFVIAKMNNQAVLLGSASRNREQTKTEIARTLSENSRMIREYIRSLPINEPSTKWRSELMRIEAEASEIYWQGVKLILQDIVDFPGRKKRFDRPEDPVNVMLNYGYNFLASNVWLAVEHVGLDPYAGFLHVDSPRRPALVMDLMEEFRQPIVDRAVLKIMQDSSDVKRIVEDHKLSRDARLNLLKALGQRLEQRVTFENRALPLGSHIILQARRLAETIMGRDSYKPYMER